MMMIEKYKSESKQQCKQLFSIVKIYFVLFILTFPFLWGFATWEFLNKEINIWQSTKYQMVSRQHCQVLIGIAQICHLFFLLKMNSWELLSKAINNLHLTINKVSDSINTVVLFSTAQLRHVIFVRILYNDLHFGNYWVRQLTFDNQQSF
jgi:hypothetical protein